MINRIATLFLGAVFAAGGVVHAQTSQPARLTDAEVAQIDASIRAEMRALGDSALALGFSAKEILSTAAEGKLKGATPANILDAARNRLRNWTVVRTELGTAATFQDVKAGAAALVAGANVRALATIARERRGNATLYASFSVLSDLVTTSNVPIDTAVRVVTWLAATGARDADLNSYRKAVQSDIALGGIPSVAATMRVEAIVQASGNDFDYVRGPINRATGRPLIPPEN